MLWLKTTILSVLAVGFVVFADECGQRVSLTQELVHFGNRSRLGEWPWHAALFHRMNRASPTYACGGTIVSQKYVITAAHCTYPQSRVRALKPSEILIRAGIANLQLLEHSLQQQAVVEIIRHEEYNTDTIESDIAVLKCAGELEFNGYVRPICFWSGADGEELIVGKEGIIAGWGSDEKNELHDDLKHAVMPVVARKTCRDSDPDYYTRYLYDRKTFCAGFRNGTSAGLGDSGGGLYVEMEGKWVLRGIVSNGKLDPVTQLLDTSSYLVFTDVAYFMGWIRKKLNIGEPVRSVTTPVQDYAVCGKKKELQFMRPGFKEERKWPWHGEIYRQTRSLVRLCEVAVISEYFLLSPAEVYDAEVLRNPSKLLVIFKILKGGKETILLQQQVERIVIHEEFQRETRMKSIALVEMKAPLKFTDNLRPICLWSGENWAFSGSTGHLGDSEDRMREHDSCSKIYRFPQEKLGAKSFCYEMSSYTFRGILSDLLFFKYQDSWYLRGIPYNMVRMESVIYVLLLDVTKYQSWITKNAVVRSRDLLGLGSCPEKSYSQWMYQIHSNYQFQCYASLITPEFLVATASCVNEIPISSLELKHDHYGHAGTISTVFQHPSFDSLELTNNVAIVRLSTPLSKTPICIPKVTAKPTQLPLRAISWQSAYSRANPVAFHSANFVTTDVRSCSERWRREGAQVETSGAHLCGQMVGIEQGFWFYCPTNLHGAPLIYGNNGSDFLRGILDIGKSNHCERNDLPEVYVDLMSYGEWIVQVVFRGKSESEVGKLVPSVGTDPTRNEWRNAAGSE